MSRQPVAGVMGRDGSVAKINNVILPKCSVFSLHSVSADLTLCDQLIKLRKRLPRKLKAMSVNICRACVVTKVGSQ